MRLLPLRKTKSIQSHQSRPIRTTSSPRATADQAPHQSCIVPLDLLTSAQSLSRTCDKIADAYVESLHAVWGAENGVEEDAGKLHRGIGRR